MNCAEFCIPMTLMYWPYLKIGPTPLYQTRLFTFLATPFTDITVSPVKEVEFAFSWKSRLPSLYLNSDTTEAVFMAVLDRRRPVLLLGCVYRTPPPQRPGLQLLFSQWIHWKTLVNFLLQPHLTGRFNVNILSPTLSTQHRYLNNLISDFNLRKMITSPTRTPSQLCLDLILAPVHLPKDYKVISSGITFLDGLTDHHLVGIGMALPLHRSPRNKHVHKYRSPPLDKTDFQGLLSHISRAFQTADISCMSLDEATAFWQRSILAGLDVECPVVQARSSNKPRPHPWMTPELQSLQRQRKLIHRQSIQNPTNTYFWR